EREGVERGPPAPRGASPRPGAEPVGLPAHRAANALRPHRSDVPVRAPHVRAATLVVLVPYGSPRRADAEGPRPRARASVPRRSAAPARVAQPVRWPVQVPRPRWAAKRRWYEPAAAWPRLDDRGQPRAAAPRGRCRRRSSRHRAAYEPLRARAAAAAYRPPRRAPRARVAGRSDPRGPPPPRSARRRSCRR